MHKAMKIVVVAALILAVAAIVRIKQQRKEGAPVPGPATPTVAALPEASSLPRLVDLGAGKCIPCKMMAPILEELKEEYAGRMEVVFIDVWENPDAAKPYGIQVIPTQIFYDAAGKEVFRHEGFFSKEDILAKWKELGVDLSASGLSAAPFERLTPARADERPKERICYMCDGDIDARTLVTVQTDKGSVRMCGPHCYFIMYSCLTEDKTDFEKKVTVTDWATGKAVPITEAVFLSGEDEAAGRPWVKAFAARDAAVAERSGAGGSILNLESLAQKEMSHRCGFCDRACYPQDAAEVIVEGGVHTWGCCSHCALGVAARTGKDIEVREKDRLTKQPVIVKTFEGKVASLEPATAVAWFGQRQKPDGTWASAGCFHQGFFASADNLRKWVEQNPLETGRLISISQALADKMKLTPTQIQKACKIGECAPK
ncbi:MAG TPA: organomercurial lyase [Sedimentisphaerales bacterium]|nr:organomercurial lyase [Sedimentisphaerales bacterium]HRS12564.1 organomercurial lyase [Sedimentisphaerales bacterium]HRV49188.1 organomercurial lyase [Sedimentisphaerales bacterium]